MNTRWLWYALGGAALVALAAYLWKSGALTRAKAAITGNSAAFAPPDGSGGWAPLKWLQERVAAIAPPSLPPSSPTGDTPPAGVVDRTRTMKQPINTFTTKGSKGAIFS